MSKKMKKLETNKVYEGNSLDVLKTFPDESLDMCVTSPPYWGLRDYEMDDQLGLESTPEKFINNLCDIFDEIVMLEVQVNKTQLEKQVYNQRSISITLNIRKIIVQPTKQNH